ncbi:MAG: PH domain-containing protein [Chloroflexi bacterium]|nr:PH domain-containing protein [Chloroflexota bacterium]MBP7043186.1 PH domain-containing protein [Chloroflexota bacterium]
MSIQDTHAQLKSEIWQAVEQSGIDLSRIDKGTLTSLVDVVMDATLMALDDEMGKQVQSETSKVVGTAVSNEVLDDDKEDILWEGRPFLSISLQYTITDERIRITSGFLGKARENIELVRIQDLDYKQALSERMINIGDISILSHDRSEPRIVLKNVKDPEAVYEILRRAVLHARKRHGFTYREEM